MGTITRILDVMLDFYLRNPYVSNVFLWILAIGIVICSLILISQNRVFERTARGIMKAMEAAKQSTERRQEEEERLQQEVGNREKKNVFYCMDETLYHAGIKEKLPWITVEILILFVGVVMFTVLFIVSKLTGTFVMGVAAALLVLTAAVATLKLMCYIRNRKVEEGLLQFANLIENYSRTSDDIVGIFGKVYWYLEEPLRSTVAECYSEAATTGDFSKACSRLTKVIGNRQLTNLLNNLEICSRHEANYEAVTKANKKIIRDYITEKELRREMANSARMQVVVLVVIGIMIISMLNSMTNGILFRSLLNTELGNILLAAISVFVVFAAYKLLTMGQDS